MRILTIMSEEEEESIHDNTDLSNSEEEEASTEPETKPVAPELEPGPEVEIISSVTEESGVVEAATEVAMREEREQIHLPEVEQSQFKPQTKRKPKKTDQKHYNEDPEVLGFYLLLLNTYDPNVRTAAAGDGLSCREQVVFSCRYYFIS
jgi:hypothetical protein